MTSANFGPVSGTSAQSNAQTQTQVAQNRIVATAYARTTLDNIAGAIQGGHDFLQGANARAYPRWGKITAASVSETADGVPVTLSTTKVTITPAEALLGVDLSDGALAGLSPANVKYQVALLLGRGYADYVDSQGLAQISNADSGNTVGSTGSALTLDVFLQAITKLEYADADGPYAAIFHTKALQNLRTVLGGTTTTTGAQATVLMRSDMLSRIGPSQQGGDSLPAGMVGNYAMTLYNVDIFKSTNCAASSTAADSESLMFPFMPGMFPFIRTIMMFPAGESLDMSVLTGNSAPLPADNAGGTNGGPWDCRYEEQRDASGRLTEMWVGGKFAWGVVATNWLVPLTSVQ